MKTEQSHTSTLEAFTALLIGLPLSILVSMYGTLLITKIVEWYSVPFHLTFKQWFGIDAIFAMVSLSISKTQDKWYVNVFSQAFIITCLFGILYLMSQILN